MSQGRKRLRKATSVTDIDRKRLCTLVEQGKLVHPMGTSTASFADLAHALALCNGLSPEHKTREVQAQNLAKQIGGQSRRHIIVVLCDGMGCTVMEQHLASDSFLRSHNDPERLVAIFPSTTPAALTTLATGMWPGQHGMPGWDLRDQKGCEYPGVAGPGPVQLRVLHSHVMDMRSHRPAKEFGFNTKDVFVASPWTETGLSSRRMLYVNAYNGTDFTNWYQGPHSSANELANIPEIAANTVDTPETTRDAIDFVKQGIDAVLAGVAEAEKQGETSYTYFYTAFPDKQMHALGVEHSNVKEIMQAIDKELSRLWAGLKGKDAALVVTADHGHITVNPENMVLLPDELIECLEYANLGVHGKGRHACLHVRSGRQEDFKRRWARTRRLLDNFLLLTVEDAASEGLFGPEPLRPEVRPRLGDFLVLSLNADTLVSPEEARKYCDCAQPQCQGAHGSLCREDLSIPFILCKP